jgi:Tfp pilus assembly protein PilV
MMDQRGQTLIELMAAVFVITTGLLGVLGLTTANVRSETTAVMRLTAFNLAREGVEFARNMRDSNWLSGLPWNTGLIDAGTGRCVVMLVSLASAPFQLFGDIVGCPDQFDGAYQMFSDSASGVYAQYTGIVPTGATSTQYYRTILLDPICLDVLQTDFDNRTFSNVTETVKSGGCGANVMAGVQVTSEVAWKIAGRTQTARVIERLYNWR